MTAGSPIGDRQATTVLDCSGLLCPLPVYKASVALKSLAPGEVLELICTDPGAASDIPAMARQLGDTLLATEETAGTFRFWVEKGDRA